MATSGVKMTVDRAKLLMAQVKALTKNEVLIGVPAADPQGRNPGSNERKGGGPATNAVIGYVQETGDPERNIPARPFLVPGVESVGDQCAIRLGQGAKAALGGSADAADKAMHAAGLIAQSAVRKKITDGPFEPLSPKTIAAREARGRSGTKPLIDTGQLRNSISYVIRPKGK